MLFQASVTSVVITALLAIGLCVGSQGKDEKTSRSITKIVCPEDAQVLIKRAFFPRPAGVASDRCTEDCAPFNGSLSASSCKRRGWSCWGFFTNQELNIVYRALDSGSPTKLYRAAKHLNRTGKYLITYKCLHKGPKVVDPCADEQPEQWVNRTFTSILVGPQKLQDQQRQCIKVCTFKLSRRFRFQTKFVLKEGYQQRGRYSLKYQFVSRQNNSQVRSVWRPLTGDIDPPGSVEKLMIQFHLNDLSAVTRLWISSVGKHKEFSSFSCQSAQTFMILRKDEGEDGAKRTYVLAVVCGCGGLAVVVIIILAVVALIRYRKYGHVIRNTSDRSRSPGLNISGRITSDHNMQSEEEQYIELDDTVHDYHYATAPNLATADLLSAARTTVMGDTTEFSQGKHEGTTFSAIDQTSGVGVEKCSVQHPQDSRDSQTYSKPQIYMNASEDYHPYTSLKSNSQRQDTPSLVCSDTYEIIPERKKAYSSPFDMDV